MIDDFKPGRKPVKSLQPVSETRLTSAEEQKPTKIKATDEVFKTPDEVALEDQVDNTLADLDLDEADSEEPERSEKKRFRFLPKSRAQWLAFGGILLILIAGGAAFFATKSDAPIASSQAGKVAKKAPPKPTTVASFLSGLQVDPTVNERPVIAVMIENSLDSRPQSGLSQAGVVFEAIAEGGITRFLALYQDKHPTSIGPIRSARPYYVQWAHGFNAAYSHVGGSPEALSNIKEWGVRDLDQYYNGNSYQRVSHKAPPHNVYSNLNTLTELAKAKGFTTSNFTSFTRKTEAPAKVATAKTINLKISGPAFNVQYAYDRATNSYQRSVGGSLHTDNEGNVQLSPKTVIALVMSYGYKPDGQHSDYGTIGSGSMYVFQDGVVTEGTWTKNDNASNFVFTDATGAQLALNPGQAWITIVDASADVTYVP